MRPAGVLHTRREHFLRALKRTATITIVCLALLLIVSMWATELTRLVASQTARSPIALPAGVDLRRGDRLVALLGKGTPDGNAAAVTLGHVIVVPATFDQWPLTLQQQVVEHELMHVRQRERYWRFYLPVYAVLYVLHGYENHPFEREARAGVLPVTSPGDIPQGER